MVLQDDVKKTCLGAVLLHIYDEQSAQGKVRILSASYNPSSTFLYQVNERELFAALHRQLEQFALDNSVDLLTVSRNRWIRTNRNEGEFEQAIKGQVAAVNEEVLLRKPQPFCHAFNYQNDILDVTWKRPKVMERFVKWFASWRNRKN
jgi:superfamily II DNA helicase RecQ